MKRIIPLLVMMLSPVLCPAQLLEVVEQAKKIYIANTPFDYSKNHCYGVDCYYQIPYFPDLANYMSKNIRYPVVCEENGVQGDVYINFYVERDGAISDVSLVKGSDPALDKEALRFANSMPRWIPGKINGKIVRTKYTIRIGFRLN